MGCSPKQQPNSRRVFALGMRSPTAAPASPSKRMASSSSSDSNNSSNNSNSSSPGRRRNPARRAVPSTPPAPVLVLAFFVGLLLLPRTTLAAKQVAMPPPASSPSSSLPSNLTTHVHADAALFPSAALKGFDREIRALMANKSLNGARVLGAQKGRIVLDYSLGYDGAAAAGGEPWFRLFSMTKPVTAALTLVLAEEGVLSLDDEFAKYIPELGNLTVYDGIEEFLAEEEEELVEEAEGPLPRKRKQKQKKKPGFLAHPAPRNATIRELLTHTAGFAYGDNVGKSPVDDAYDSAVLQDFYRHTEESFLRVRACPPLVLHG